MRSKKISQTVKTFEEYGKAQEKYQYLFDELTEEEEAEFERRLFTQGVTITKASISQEPNGC